MIIKNSKGFAVIISSPSGVGKTTVTKGILKKIKQTKLSISWTTRSPRLTEINKKDYIFSSKKKFFSNIKKNNFFLEHAKVFGNYYGTPKKEILNDFKKGKIVILDIDWQGSRKVKRILGEKCVSIFLLPPSFSTLKKRLINRHKNDLKVANKRFSFAKEDIKHWIDYDYVIINENLGECIKCVAKIIEHKFFKEKLENNARKQLKQII